jgi:hypothetical protein
VPEQPAPELRVISVGFEGVTDPAVDLAELDRQLDAAGANAIALSAGRMEWTTFPWPGHESQWSSQVRESGRDLFAAAIAAIGPDRHVSAVVDAFSPRTVTEHPELAARDVYGQASEYQASLTALTEGRFGTDLLAMIDHVAATYAVDSINLTELHYDVVGFGDDDKSSYLAWSGREDWPRLADGQIDVHDASLGEWKSGLVASFVGRAADIAHRHGKELFVDVRVSWDDLDRNAAEHGQEYTTLLQHADRLVVWNYFGMTDRGAAFTEQLAGHLAEIGSDRFIMSIGLWGSVTPDDLMVALGISSEHRLAGAWVTPVSRFEPGHWDALGALWRRPGQP